MRFTDGYAPAPFCCPTRRSLLIGQHPARHIYQRDQDGWTERYRHQLSIPRLLKAAHPQYRTAHFGKWDMRFDEVTPEEMGYDVSDGYTGNRTGGLADKKIPKVSDDPKLAFSLTSRACRFIQDQVEGGHPFFVQISHYAVHLDIYSRAATLQKYQNRPQGRKHHIPAFAAMTEDLDHCVGQVLDTIDELGIDQSTYVFFMSDNGGRLTLPGHAARSPARKLSTQAGQRFNV